MTYIHISRARHYDEKYDLTESYSTSAQNMTGSHIPRGFATSAKICLRGVIIHVSKKCDSPESHATSDFGLSCPGRSRKVLVNGWGQNGGGNADMARTLGLSIRLKAYLFIWLVVRSDSSVTTRPCHRARHIMKIHYSHISGFYDSAQS